MAPVCLDGNLNDFLTDLGFNMKKINTVSGEIESEAPFLFGNNTWENIQKSDRDFTVVHKKIDSCSY